MEILFFAALILYFAAMLVQFVSAGLKKPGLGRAARALFLAGFDGKREF